MRPTHEEMSLPDRLLRNSFLCHLIVCNFGGLLDILLINTHWILERLYMSGSQLALSISNSQSISNLTLVVIDFDNIQSFK